MSQDTEKQIKSLEQKVRHLTWTIQKLDSHLRNGTLESNTMVIRWGSSSDELKRKRDQLDQWISSHEWFEDQRPEDIPMDTVKPKITIKKILNDLKTKE
jgi:hypothetical protein